MYEWHLRHVWRVHIHRLTSLVANRRRLGEKNRGAALTTWKEMANHE